MIFNNLNVSLVSALLHPKYGGPSEVLRLHALALSQFVDVNVFGIADGDNDEVFLKKSYLNAIFFKRRFPYRWFYGKGLLNALTDKARNVDIFHAHMLWDYPVYASSKAAKVRKVPLIITPHGSLNGAWRYRGVVKNVYRNLILDRILNEAACIHVLNRAEEIACRDYGIKCPIEIIPNGLPSSAFNSVKIPSLAFEKWPQLSGRRIMLYLGRLWHGKGLDILPNAWMKAKHIAEKYDWLLVLAGPDYGGYREILEKQIIDNNLSNSVFLTGPVYGDLKDSLFAASTAYVLPSHGEGFSMSLLEAIAAKLPVIFTNKCNATEFASCGGGWESEDSVDGLVDVFSSLLEADDEFFQNAGLAAWVYAKERYSLENISNKLLNMYKIAIHSY